MINFYLFLFVYRNENLRTVSYTDVQYRLYNVQYIIHLCAEYGTSVYVYTTLDVYSCKQTSTKSS